MVFTWADYTIISIISLSILISCKRGFLREMLSLAAWGVSFLLSILFAARLASLLTPYIAAYSIRFGLSFLGIFALSFIVITISNYLIIHLVTKTGLSNNNLLLSIIFGSTRGIILTILILLSINFTTLTQKSWWQDSIIIPACEPIILWLETLWSDKIDSAEIILNND